MKHIDKFGRPVTQVQVNWKWFDVSKLKVGDLVHYRDKPSWSAIVTGILGGGNVTIRWVSLDPDYDLDLLPSFDDQIPDYELELISPVD